VTGNSTVTQASKEARYRANLQGEIDSSALYRALAEIEADPRIAEVYQRLAGVAEAHAAFWRKRLGGRGRRRMQPGFRSRALAWLARRFGAALVLPVINALQQADSSQFDAQPEAAVLGRIEGSHRGIGGNALRATVLGANDGLVSNLSLVTGVVSRLPASPSAWRGSSAWR